MVNNERNKATPPAELYVEEAEDGLEEGERAKESRIMMVEAKSLRTEYEAAKIQDMILQKERRIVVEWDKIHCIVSCRVVSEHQGDMLVVLIGACQVPITCRH